MKQACAGVAAFGAVNWMTFKLWGVDAVTATLGSGRTIGTDALHFAVALVAIYPFVAPFLPSRKKS
ncbi:MAG: hypothetical protein ACYTGN_12210 [Planctomycetota bacterium]|jgi:uncharacterized membrane protein YuzA (DUF378 family)